MNHFFQHISKLTGFIGPKLFVSYRRSEGSQVVGRMKDRLDSRFWRWNVFVDTESIPLGVNFQDFVSDSIEECDVVLMVIGPDWLGGQEKGMRRIDQEFDPIRFEVMTAQENGRRIIPILIDDASMPGPSELPEEIQKFDLRNAQELRGGIDFNSDYRRLTHNLPWPQKIRLLITFLVLSVLLIPFARMLLPQDYGVPIVVESMSPNGETKLTMLLRVVPGLKSGSIPLTDEAWEQELQKVDQTVSTDVSKVEELPLPVLPALEDSTLSEVPSIPREEVDRPRFFDPSTIPDQFIHEPITALELPVEQPESANVLDIALREALLTALSARESELRIRVNLDKMKIETSGLSIPTESWIKICNIMNEVEEAYWKLLVMYREVDACRSKLDVLDRIAERVKAYQNVEQLSNQQFSVDVAQANVINAKTNLQRAISHAKNAEQTLKSIIAFPDLHNSFLRPIDEPVFNEIQFDLDYQVHHVMSVASPVRPPISEEVQQHLFRIEQEVRDQLEKLHARVYEKYRIMKSMETLVDANSRQIKHLEVQSQVGVASFDKYSQKLISQTQSELAFYRAQIEYELSIKDVVFAAGSLINYRDVTLVP